MSGVTEYLASIIEIGRQELWPALITHSQSACQIKTLSSIRVRLARNYTSAATHNQQSFWHSPILESY
jgi:hypothetical protein